ncbi:hypothetical protein LX32DRAFT_426314 [Colletotrichum zoysiae]|uniref:Uncharacterized protein n=1 Tax=Colletotrichum zoysiae TaxID=1216348 RepID=A0AAD9M432_9PEZI|nr:hypothetical protein LX32DRAFT_426314 [Colletotrichum zoysiae]
MPFRGLTIVFTSARNGRPSFSFLFSLSLSPSLSAPIPRLGRSQGYQAHSFSCGGRVFGFQPPEGREFSNALCRSPATNVVSKPGSLIATPLGGRGIKSCPCSERTCKVRVG